MKKNLLFGIALIMLIGCSKKEENEVSPAKVKNQNNLKSAPASYVWETFSPCLKPTNYPINACVAITITTDPKPCCKCNGTFSKPLSDEIELAHYNITGGIKYRVNFLHYNDSIGATSRLTIPSGNVAPQTLVEWETGDCFLWGSANGVTNARFELQSLVFERYVPFKSDSLLGATETMQGVNGTVYVNGHCGSHDGQPYPMGSIPPSSIYVTRTVNKINYGGTIPFKSISYRAFTIQCDNFAREEYTPWAAIYSGTIPKL